MDNMGKLKPGTRFRGNVNGAEMEVVDIWCKYVKVKDLKTGICYVHTLQMLERCDVMILDK